MNEAGGDGTWHGSDFHGIAANENLTAQSVTQTAARRWLQPKQYLAILMNHARYIALQSRNTATLDENDVMRGSIYLCDLGATDQVEDWVMLEESPVVVGGYGQMLMKRWANDTLEKRRYTLLTGVGMAVVHYLPATREQKRLSKLKVSLNDLNAAVCGLDDALSKQKTKVANKIQSVLNRRKNRR